MASQASRALSAPANANPAKRTSTLTSTSTAAETETETEVEKKEHADMSIMNVKVDYRATDPVTRFAQSNWGVSSTFAAIRDWVSSVGVRREESTLKKTGSK